MDDEGTMDLNFNTDESKHQSKKKFNDLLIKSKNISRRSDKIHPKSNGR